jgi:hypothetical protein
MIEDMVESATNCEAPRQTALDDRIGRIEFLTSEVVRIKMKVHQLKGRLVGHEPIPIQPPQQESAPKKASSVFDRIDEQLDLLDKQTCDIFNILEDLEQMV